jgi:hypothetical protein
VGTVRVVVAGAGVVAAAQWGVVVVRGGCARGATGSASTRYATALHKPRLELIPVGVVVGVGAGRAWEVARDVPPYPLSSGTTSLFVPNPSSPSCTTLRGWFALRLRPLTGVRRRWGGGCMYSLVGGRWQLQPGSILRKS